MPTKNKKNNEEKSDIEIKNVPEKKEVKAENKIPDELIQDPNISPIFDVFYYREVFMSLRQKLDDLYEKREKAEKDLAEYDDAVYNITVNAVTDSSAQDFLSYCYKKGKYDFCLMNFEKYMKWSVLSASNGNAFSLSKLQLFFTSAIEEVLNMEHHDYMLDFLELTPENYYVFITKLICEEMVKNLQISAEALIKMPEAYQEQTEEILRSFDNAKMNASKNVKETLKKAIEQLGELIKKQDKKESPPLEKAKNIKEDLKEKIPKAEEKKLFKGKTAAAKKAPTIKKFRW